MYAVVNTTLYRYFAIIGGPYLIGSIVSAVVMTLLVRRKPAIFRWALAGAVLLGLAFVSWLLLVQPVNRQVAAALESSPGTVPSLWLQLRGRWEYGHDRFRPAPNGILRARRLGHTWHAPATRAVVTCYVDERRTLEWLTPLSSRAVIALVTSRGASSCGPHHRELSSGVHWPLAKKGSR
jgi:hypothetical protein